MEHRFEIPLVWDSVSKIRLEVGVLFSSYIDEVRDRAVMIASELAENIVKYGAVIDDERVGFITVCLSDEQFSIHSHNAVGDIRHVQAVEAIIEEINDSDDPSKLSISRLRKLIAGSVDGPSQLGLLRVATDGNSDLSCRFGDTVLTIEAVHRDSVGDAA
tara:strand:- start:270 stop:749 length:480 start_codon:yes stop_codon:yes gene_type:complete